MIVGNRGSPVAEGHPGLESPGQGSPEAEGARSGWC